MKGRCKKVKFAREIDADAHIERYRATSKRDPEQISSYFCDECTAWHVTSHDFKKKRILELEKEVEFLRMEVKFLGGATNKEVLELKGEVERIEKQKEFEIQEIEKKKNLEIKAIERDIKISARAALKRDPTIQHLEKTVARLTSRIRSLEDNNNQLLMNNSKVKKLNLDYEDKIKKLKTHASCLEKIMTDCAVEESRERIKKRIDELMQESTNQMLEKQ